MDESFKIFWEKHLESDKNKSTINNWEKFSDRFGKTKLLNLFENWDKFLMTNNTSFKIAFEHSILSPLKKNKNLDFVKKTTYSSLMSLFSKFRYFLKEYKSGLYDNLSIDSAVCVNHKNQSKKNITKNLEFIPKEEQIMPYEKKYFKINQFGDVLAPWSDTSDKIDYNEVIYEEEKKQEKKINKKFIYGIQLELPFDEIL